MQKSVNIIKHLVFGGIFLTPFLVLIVSGTMFFPFITGKNFAFRILAEVIAALWIVLMLFDARYKPRRTLISVVLAVFIFILALSSVFGENFYRSFWSNYERMEGLVTYLHLFAFFLVLTSVMRTEKIWKWFLHTSLGVSVIVGIYGVLQIAGKLAIHQGDRVDATLGNASYLAIYMAFHIFLALIYFFRQKDGVRWFYAPVIALQSFILYSTATRGAMLGMAGGLLLAAVLIAIFSQSKKIKVSAAAVLLLIIILIGNFWFMRDSNFVKNSPVLHRFADISLTETTTESRLTIWKMSWEGFKTKPILGWGLENYNLVFNKYYEPILWKQEPWFDRAHNVFFDRMTTGGSLGLLAYLGLFAAAIYYLWRKRKFTGFSVYDSALFTAMFAAYFFHNVFVFDNLISLVMFFVFLAYIHTRATMSDKPVASTPADYKNAVSHQENNYGKATAAVVVAGLFIFIFYTVNIPGGLAARGLIDAFQMVAKGDAQKSFEGFQKVIAYNSFGGMEAREHLSNFAMNVYGQPNVDAGLKEKIAVFAVDELKKQNKQFPNDIREMLFLGALYNKIGKYDEAIEILNKAKEISPKKQQLYFELSSSYLNKKEYDKGLEILRKVFELDTDFLDARKIYAVSAIFADKLNLAKEIMKDSGGVIIADDRFLRAFAQRNDLNSVIAILNKFLEENPNDIAHRLNLAAVYAQINERGKAVKELETVIAKEPKFKEQGEYYIKEIKAGRNP